MNAIQVLLQDGVWIERVLKLAVVGEKFEGAKQIVDENGNPTGDENFVIPVADVRSIEPASYSE